MRRRDAPTLAAGLLADLWVFNTSSAEWEDLSLAAAASAAAASAPADPAAPAARAFGGLAAAGGRLYLFGGQGPTVFLGDLRAWDPASGAWADLSPAAAAAGGAPVPRAYHALAAAGGRLYLFGGWADTGARHFLRARPPLQQPPPCVVPALRAALSDPVRIPAAVPC